MSPVRGYFHPHFEAVAHAFRRNLESGLEEAGASFAVYHRGKLVVDIHGGWADADEKRLWQEDTLCPIFSCTKSVAAICTAMLIERGHVSYTDRIASFWPEFAQNGKENIRLEHLLTHQAGLPYLGVVLSLEELSDVDEMDRIVEQARPLWTPGSRTAYQPLTYGWILDGIFRRVDPFKRSVGEFFRQEIQNKYNLDDFFLGEASAVASRVARLRRFSKRLAVREACLDWKVAVIGLHYLAPCGNFQRCLRDMSNFGTDFTMFNNEWLRETAQPAVNAVASAAALAKVHELLLEGCLLNEKSLEMLKQPVFTAFDETIGESEHKGHGWQYLRSPHGSWQMMHPGIGGQNVRVDFDAELSMAYLTNGMKASSGDHVFPFRRLQKKVYDAISTLP